MTPSARSRLPLLVVPLLVAPLAGFYPETAASQAIVKCAGPDGTTIFTDKSCDAFGATLVKDFAFTGGDNAAPARLRDAPVGATEDGFVGNGFAIKGCARTKGELIAGVRESISRGDVNRLSNYYHWTGMGSSAAFATMERLDKMVRNTMAGVAFDYPQPTYDYGQPSEDYAAYDGDVAREQTTASLSAAVAMAAVAYHDGPSILAAYRGENDDVPYTTGIVDASTPLSDRTSATTADGTAAPTPNGGIVDASTPLGEARMTTLADTSGAFTANHAYNPQPTALRVSLGGGTGQRFKLRQNAGCWFISF